MAFFGSIGGVVLRSYRSWLHQHDCARGCTRIQIVQFRASLCGYQPGGVRRHSYDKGVRGRRVGPSHMELPLAPASMVLLIVERTKWAICR